MLRILSLFAFVCFTLAEFKHDYDYTDYGSHPYNEEKKYDGLPDHFKLDGTVYGTPEVKHDKAEHFKAFTQIKSYNSYHHDSPYGGGYKKSFEPAPLNDDGTVDDTEDIKHAKALLSKAYEEAMSRINPGPHFSGEQYDYFEDYYPSHHDSTDSFSKKYKGSLAPLNHDGTVSKTPEVNEAKAIHFDLYNRAFRHKRDVHYTPAPLNADGTVAETPEVQKAKATFLAAYAAEAAHADHSWVEPKYDDASKYDSYVEPVQYSFSSQHIPDDGHPSSSYHFTPVQEYSDNFEPAPLNHDGTVAETPEILAAKAVHFAAHQEAHSRAISPKFLYSYQ